MSPALVPAGHSAGGLCEGVEKRFCGLEIGRVEPFGKPVEDRLEERHRISGTGLIAQQPGQAHGGAQLPGQSALAARPTERLLVVIFGRSCGARSSLQQQKLASDAQQLGSAPAFFIALGSRERLVDCFESLGNLSGMTKPCCQLAKEPREAWLEAGLASLLKRDAQKPQPGIDIAIPDQQGCVEALAPRSPERQRMGSGAFAQHRRIAFGGRQIAGE